MPGGWGALAINGAITQGQTGQASVGIAPPARSGEPTGVANGRNMTPRGDTDRAQSARRLFAILALLGLLGLLGGAWFAYPRRAWLGR